MKSAKQRNLRQQRSRKAKSERRAARISHQESVGLNPLRFGSEELQERFNQVVPFAFLFIQFVPNYASYLSLLKEFGPEAGLAILTCPKFWDLLQSSYSRSEAARLTLLHLDSKLRAGDGSGLTTGW
ncbi:MAG: hypothetical protein ROM54_12585 [Anaerobiospirillum sp.]|nr:hypothetical protein [Anaerobiospirillum sp.]